MKLSMFFVALLSVSSLFGADTVNEEASKAKIEASVARTEASAARIEALNAKAETSVIRNETKESKAIVSKTTAELEKANSIIERNALEKAQSKDSEEAFLAKSKKVYISVVGQGVAPMNTVSPAQAYALAKRAAIADAYRGLAEKIKGVRVEGHDLIKNMMMQRSTIRTGVEAMVKNANIVETTFKEGLCEVEMEIVISYSDFSQ
ncbi:LPP20 family lipoprotein [Sulfurimonas sp.]|uniref:LPP20 family lipoprotein n=1 Tax=Sulfurimonas sp. TaxID=2022749 RepID=UPI0025D2B74C|nr:LPP20 family lipoprotein [Sulfurimonas sp.]MDD5158189.1 LPP20 family lipoprotein [Sulfurimonas sp.]